MEVTKRNEGDVLVIELNGKLDTSTSGVTQDELVQLVKDGQTKIVLNLKNLDYVSSAGLRVILIMSKLLQSHQGELRLCMANEFVGGVLEKSGFNSLLQILDTEENAIASIYTK